MRKPILITNDDGFFSDSLEGLIEALNEVGDVVAIVPEQERSGVSHAITLHKPLRCRKVKIGGVEAYITNGTPTDCVLLGKWEIMKQNPPALVVSGINRGPNLGEDSLYSGTVAAAREGTILGIPAFSISVAEFDGILHFELAFLLAKILAEKIISTRNFPDRTFLNVNLPNLPQSSIRGIQVTRLGRRRYKDVIERREDPRGRIYYWIDGGRVETDTTPGTDSKAIADGFISISPVRLDFATGDPEGFFLNWDNHLWDKLKGGNL